MASIMLIHNALIEAVARTDHYFNVEIRIIEYLLILERRIPSLRYRALRKGEKKNGECVICLESFTSWDLVRVARVCKHCYHVKCIDEWFREHRNCPICRKNILPVEYRVEI
jgi:hypothetical protein